MRSIKERLNKKGFTLAELLIVVAIIAVLVAVSVPVFNSKLEKSREATDVANMRAAKAAVIADYLNGDIEVTDSPVYYDADNGKIVKELTSIANDYGQGTKIDGKTSYADYKPNEEAKGKVIEITITASGTGDTTDADNVSFTMKWVSKK